MDTLYSKLSDLMTKVKIEISRQTVELKKEKYEGRICI